MKLFNWLRKKTTHLSNFKTIETQKDEKTNDVPMDIKPVFKITIERAQTEHKPPAKKVMLSMVELNGYKSMSGGYMSHTEFLVSGHIINEETGRKNIYRQTVYAQTKEEAIDKIKEVPFIDDYKIDIVLFDKPTERQLDFASDIGISIPDDATKPDVSDMISRFTRSYGDVIYDEPQRSPSEAFALFACNNGVFFSKFIGEEDIFSSTVHKLKDKDRVAFYAYCIVKSHNSVNVATDPVYPDLTEYYKFAESVINSESIMRSINERTSYDYRSPHKGSKSYKAVAEYFHL